MAVIQISKIQHRRGQKNSSSGIPQLSSAEFAWAVDTQELFIGNGSIAEGAPYVGNTKILTEHDNILDLANTYQFAFSDPAITGTVSRSLQSKLDQTVSIADFGGVGDGLTDNASAFRAAFAALFNNVDPKYRKVLLIPNGEYVIASSLQIPADLVKNVIIQGETQLGSILNIQSNNISFVTTSGLVFNEFESTDRPANFTLSNLTVKRSTGQFNISGLGNSLFDNVKFIGEYELGNEVTPTPELAVVYWLNDRTGVAVDGVKFNDCTFEYNEVSIGCRQTLAFDSTVIFEDCKFYINYNGIYVDGVAEQGTRWQINSCQFETIAKEAFKATAGRGTLIQRTSFKNCGNDENNAATPTSSIVSFGEKVGNVLVDCITDRQQAANIAVSLTSAAIPEVANCDKATFVNRNYSNIALKDGFTQLMIFSAQYRYIKLNYFLALGEFSRVGTLTMTVSSDQSEVEMSDEYHYSSALETQPGGQVMTKFEFEASLIDSNADSTIDTVLVRYKNPILTGATGTISFDVAYGV